MLINLLAFEKLAKDDEAKFDSKTNSVKQAFQYLRNNKVAVNNIKDYKILFETLKDTQNFDLRYKRLILQKINQTTLDGKIPTQQELNTLAAGFGPYIKSKEVMLTLKNYTHELAVVARNDISKEFIKETVNEAIREIKNNNPDLSATQEGAIRAREIKIINRNITGDPIETEEVEYKIDSEKLKDDFDKTENVGDWAKKNNLKFSTEELAELDNGYNNEIVDKAVTQKETEINACNKVISEYFEKNVSRVSDTSFDKDLTTHIGEYSTGNVNQTYANYNNEINNLIQERTKKFKENYIDKSLTNDVADQELIVEQKTQAFIDDPGARIPTYTKLRQQDLLDAIGRSNPDIQPYLSNKSSTFPPGMSQEEINLLQSKTLGAKKYSNIVYNFYNPRANQLLGYGSNLKSYLDQYEKIKDVLGDKKIFLPYNRQSINLDKLYSMLREKPVLVNQMTAGQRVAQFYYRFDKLSFGSLTRGKKVEKWIGFSRKWFGESSGDYTAMWLNNFIKGGTKQTIEQGLGKFVETAGERMGGDGLVWKIRNSLFGAGQKAVGVKNNFLSGIKNSLFSAGQKAVNKLGKTALGGTIKKILATIGGAASAGIIPLVMGIAELLKKLKKPINKLLKALGVDLGEIGQFLKNSLGLGPETLKAMAAMAVAIAAGINTMVLAAVGTVASAIGPIVGVVLVVVVLCQLFTSGMASSLVPPQFYGGASTITKNPKLETSCYTTNLGARLWLLPTDNDDVCGTKHGTDDTEICDKENSLLLYVGLKYCSGTTKEQCYLERHVVEMYYQLLNAARKDLTDDSDFKDLRVFEGYRDYRDQALKWDLMCSNSYIPTCTGCTKKPGASVAACPGESGHQSGRVIDFQLGDRTSKAYEWLKNNANNFGFFECGKLPTCSLDDEPWHWEYLVDSTGKTIDDCEDASRPGIPPPIIPVPMP